VERAGRLSPILQSDSGNQVMRVPNGPPASLMGRAYSCHNVVAKSHRTNPKIESPSFGALAHPDWQPPKCR
jgi:hypothetical protein